MNTIRTMPENFSASYTVVGGNPQPECKDSLPVTAVLLARGPKPLLQLSVEALAKAGFYHIYLLGKEGDIVDYERIVVSFPGFKVILFRNELLPGTMINTALHEICTPYALVLWNDMQFETPAFSSRFFEKLEEKKSLCIVPRLFDVFGQTVPSIKHPARQKKRFVVIALPPEKDGEPSLYPFDYCGLYDRDLFLASGGFDSGMRTVYWQTLDFGMRAWLWGNTIAYSSTLKFKYALDLEPEDTSIGDDYYSFWLKNIAAVYSSDHAILPGKKLVRFMLVSNLGFARSLKYFRDAQKWIARYQYHYKMDAVQLVDLWEPV